MTIDDPIESLQKLQKPQIAALKKMGIFSAKDILLHFPYRYLDFSKTVDIKDLKAGENITLKVKIKSINARLSFRSHMSLCEALVSDSTGSIKIVWFNQGYLAKTLKKDDEIFLAGKPDYYNFGLQLTNPIYEKISDFPVHTARLVPVYHLKVGLYPRTLRNLIKTILPLAGNLADNLPLAILKNQNLLNIQNVIELSHFPQKLEDVERVKKRIAFEEIFISQLAAQEYRLKIAKKQAFAVKFNQALIKKFVDKLPFILTLDQKKTAWEILKDLEKPMPMNRLLEGDVGSGKTLVALIAALQVMSEGFQVALLAPTEILAKQHFDTATKYLNNEFRIMNKESLSPWDTPNFPKKNLGNPCPSPLPEGEGRVRGKFKICLLTNAYSKIDDGNIPKRHFKKLVSEGMSGLFIGTHALLQKSIKFKNLALVIIDEQHRFGVEQRSNLIQSKSKVPHLLSLTATPIPRTLQMAFFGELDISHIKTKPTGRKTIISKIVENSNRAKAYQFIAKQIQEGRQTFVITPLIEESDILGIKSAKKEQKILAKIFPQFKIGLLHGKLKGAEKEKVMKEFLANKLQILVSTSVVEVGVDAPNASVIVIEGAERFGLSQLHQFRGRVGRAEHQSFCLLFPSDGLGKKLNDDTIKRLNTFVNTQDGFVLAEADLKQRGFGELYGEAQSGWNFKFFDLSYTSLITPAREEAKKILQNDLELKNYPQLKEKIKDKIIHFE